MLIRWHCSDDLLNVLSVVNYPLQSVGFEYVIFIL